MHLFGTKLLCPQALLFFVLLLPLEATFAQHSDTSKVVSRFAGAVNVTNNGISLIPSFSLGKPAVIFNLALGRKKLSFEPEMRFALEGKPWSFLFWWRYKLLHSGKFQINVGAHPAVNFKTQIATINGVERAAIVSRRYLAAELVPAYLVSENVSIGMYYLYSRGLDPDATRVTHFVTLNCRFSNIRISKQFFLKLTPQLYYLNLDNRDGYYFTASMTLARRNFPLALSAIINQTIQTDISASKNFVWNATLVYSFGKNYVIAD